MRWLTILFSAQSHQVMSCVSWLEAQLMGRGRRERRERREGEEGGRERRGGGERKGR